MSNSTVEDIAATMLGARKQCFEGDAFHDVVRDRHPHASLHEYNEAADLAWRWSRQEVADFAGWCAGSCHGDGSAEEKQARRSVMEIDYKFGWYDAEFQRYLREKAEGYRAELQDGYVYVF